MYKSHKLLFIIPAFTALCCTSCNAFSSTDVSKYEEFYSECRKNADFHSQLLIFPDTIVFGTPTNFLYKKADDLFNGSYLFYLVMQYNEDAYKDEIQRLSSIEVNYSRFNATKKIIYFEDQSLYLTISRDSRYEYALFNNETKEITYVSNQLYSWEKTGVSNKHIIEGVHIPTDFDDGNNSYNIYYYYTETEGWEITD